MLGLAVALCAGLAACTGDGESRPASDARSIDTCALFDNHARVGGRTITVIGPTMTISCTATLTGGVKSHDTMIALNRDRGQSTADWVQKQVLDGVPVTIADPARAPQRPPANQVVEQSCSLTAHLPDHVALMVTVSGAPADPTCSVGESVLRTALRKYVAKPRWGTSGFGQTILTGADPCAALARIPAKHHVVEHEGSSLNACDFALDGADMQLALEYSDSNLQSVAPDSLMAAGHRLTGDKSFGIFDLPVGKSFSVGDATKTPTVSIADLSKNMDRITVVAEAAVREFAGKR